LADWLQRTLTVRDSARPYEGRYKYPARYYRLAREAHGCRTRRPVAGERGAAGRDTGYHFEDERDVGREAVSANITHTHIFNFRHFDDNGILIPEKKGSCYHVWWCTWYRRFGKRIRKL